MTEADFDARVRAMEARMYRVCRAMLRNDADCGDAIQNAVFSAWRRLPALRDEDKLEAWVMRTLINACRDILRQRKRRGEAPLEAAENHGEEDNLRDMDLQSALEALPEKYRLCVALHHLDGYTVPEIARMLRLPQSTVKARIRVGIERMRKLLEVEA